MIIFAVAAFLVLSAVIIPLVFIVSYSVLRPDELSLADECRKRHKNNETPRSEEVLYHLLREDASGMEILEPLSEEDREGIVRRAAHDLNNIERYGYHV